MVNNPNMNESIKISYRTDGSMYKYYDVTLRKVFDDFARLKYGDNKKIHKII